MIKTFPVGGQARTSQFPFLYEFIININVENHFNALQRLLLRSGLRVHLSGSQRGTGSAVNHKTLGSREATLGDKLDPA